MSDTTKPTVITLDNKNSIELVRQYIEIAQQKGSYSLQEADLLKRSIDVCINETSDPEINNTNAKQLLIQGVNKGQSKGAYTLNDAAILYKIVEFLTKAASTNESVNESPVTNNEQPLPVIEEESDDLSDLSEPIPLRPKEV